MKTYTAQPYGCKIYFFTNLKEWFDTTQYDPEGASGVTMWWSDGIAMYVGDGRLDTLVHECTHAVLYILEHVGIEPLSSNGEPMAYLMDHMFGALMGGVHERRKASKAAFKRIQGDDTGCIEAILHSGD